MIKHYLAIGQRVGQERVFRLKSRMTIGRSSGSDIPVWDSGVSRRHAEVYFENGQVIVEDLNSQNGIFVNAERVNKAILYNGDTLRVGEMDLKFVEKEEPLDRVDLVDTEELIQSKVHSVDGFAERRGHARYHIELPVRLSISPASSDLDKFQGKTFQSTSKDVSISGIRLKVQDCSFERLPIGCQLRLEIAIPECSCTVQCNGTLRNMLEDKDNPDVWYLGIEFSDMSSDHRNLLYETYSKQLWDDLMI